MNRASRLARITLITVVLQIALGAYTRGSGSGYGCRDRWPLCEGGALGGLLPRLEFHMIVEWSHRWVASIAVLLVAATAVSVWRHHRDRRELRAAAVIALVTILGAAGLGGIVVATNLNADLVTVHLTAALALVALLTYLNVRLRSAPPPPPDRLWSGALALGCTAVFSVLLLGSLVHNEYVPGWPLVSSQVRLGESWIVPLHLAHRVAAAATLVLLVALAIAAVRRRRPPFETRMVHAAATLFVVNIGLGAAHVFTEVSSPTLVVAHLLAAALVWGCVVAAAAAATASRVPVPDALPRSAMAPGAAA